MKRLIALLAAVLSLVLVVPVAAHAQQAYSGAGEALTLARLWDGTTFASIFDLTNSNPVSVAIVDGSGTQITSFGGGVQYTEGDTDATITGTAMLWEDAADTLRTVSASKPLPMTCISGCGGPASFADNSAFTFGTTSIANAGAVVDDVATNTVAENSAGAPRMNTNRILYFNPRNNAGTEIGTAGQPIRVDPTGSTTQPVSGTVTANQGGAPWTARLQDGAGATLATVTAGNALKVDGSAVTQPVSGTVTVTDGAGALNVIVDSGSITANAGTNLNTSALALDATITNRLPAGSTPADNESNAVTTSRLGVYNYVFDGSTWDRWTGAISGTVTTSPPANASTNVAQFGGSAVVTGTGAGGAGIPRVTVSNDSSILGTKTNNNAAPGATNFGALTAVANAAAPSWTEGNLVALSTDLTGALRITGGGGGTQYDEDTAHVSGDKVTMAGVVQQTADAALSNDGDRSLLQVDSSGYLKVNVKAGGGTGGTSSTFGAAFPATGTAAGFKDVVGGTNMQPGGAYDANGGLGSEWLQGVVIRASGASGASTEAGTAASPWFTSSSVMTTTPTTAAWTSATGVDTALTLALDVAPVSKAGTVVVSFNPSGSITAGQLNFEASDDGSNWHAMTGIRMNGLTIEAAYPLNGAAKQLWQFGVEGLSSFRVRLNPVIAGAGTANIRVTSAALSPETYVTIAGGALNVNQSTNVAQFGGTNVSTGTGAGGAGIPRVTVSNDSQVRMWDGTTQVSVIAATNAAKTDLSSVAGTATVTAAAGVQKVGVVGNANAAFDAANNAAAPANVLRVGGQLQSGATATAGTAGQLGDFVGSLDHVQYARLGGPVYWSCSLDNIGATLTECKAASGAGLKYYLTDVSIMSTTATAGLFLIRTGTGTNCGTGTASLFPSAATVARFGYPANTASTGMQGFHLLTPVVAPAASAICIICVATNTCTVQMTGYTAP